MSCERCVCVRVFFQVAEEGVRALTFHYWLDKAWTLQMCSFPGQTGTSLHSVLRQKQKNISLKFLIKANTLKKK